MALATIGCNSNAGNIANPNAGAGLTEMIRIVYIVDATLYIEKV